MVKAETPQYSRASEFSRGIGANLDLVAGHDMLIHDYTVSERQMRGDVKGFVEIWLSTLDDPENKQFFHAWSDSLAEKLSELPKDSLPLVIKFMRVPTASGFKVWTFE